ncbi:unnamed protein product [Chrysoparadoxa australica]
MSHVVPLSKRLIAERTERKIGEAFQTLLVSVHCSKASSGVSDDTALSAIFNEDTQEWQQMLLELDHVDVSTVKEQGELISEVLGKVHSGRAYITWKQFYHSLKDRWMRTRTPAVVFDRSDQLLQEEMELTYRPEIAPLSQTLLESMGRDMTQPVELRLLAELDRWKQRRRAAEKLREAEDAAACTFKPVASSGNYKNPRYPNEW